MPDTEMTFLQKLVAAVSQGSSVTQLVGSDNEFVCLQKLVRLVASAVPSAGVSLVGSDNEYDCLQKLLKMFVFIQTSNPEIVATGNATVDQVLAGQTFSNATSNGLTGTLVPASATGDAVETDVEVDKTFSNAIANGLVGTSTKNATITSGSWIQPASAAALFMSNGGFLTWGTLYVVLNNLGATSMSLPAFLGNLIYTSGSSFYFEGNSFSTAAWEVIFGFIASNIYYSGTIYTGSAAYDSNGTNYLTLVANGWTIQ